MRKHTIALLGATLLVGVPACVNLDEDVVTGLTPGSYGTQAVFESLVKASYEPLRTSGRRGSTSIGRSIPPTRRSTRPRSS